MNKTQRQIDFLNTLINDQDICERLDPTIKKIKSRINYIKRNYNVTTTGKNHWQRGKINLLQHYLMQLQAAKHTNNKFEIAESIWEYEGSGTLI